MPFFSIIIPVYNTAPYLRECLDSVLNQTFTDWEAICVDDGSTDGSADILDEYAKKDTRFKVIHQKNAGVSATRNRAMLEMVGDFFLFVDADDMLRLDALQLFIPFLADNHTDGILVQPYIQYKWNGMEISEQTRDVQVLVSNASKEDLCMGEYAANGYAISRIYRKKIYDKLRFKEDFSIAEDLIFWFDSLCIDGKWLIISADYYLYRQHSNSTCGKLSPHDCESVLDSVLYAMETVSRKLGLGKTSKRKYVQRWPYFPWQYLNICMKQYKKLTNNECCHIKGKWNKILAEIGGWPNHYLFSRKFKLQYWLFTHSLSSLVPALDFLLKIRSRVKSVLS